MPNLKLFDLKTTVEHLDPITSPPTASKPRRKIRQSIPKMIIPIRCFSCGKVIADLYEKYVDLISNPQDEEGNPMADG